MLVLELFTLFDTFVCSIFVEKCIRHLKKKFT